MDPFLRPLFRFFGMVIFCLLFFMLDTKNNENTAQKGGRMGVTQGVGMHGKTTKYISVDIYYMCY